MLCAPFIGVACADPAVAPGESPAGGSSSALSGDRWFAAAAVAGVAASTMGDGWAWRQSQSPAPDASRFARVTQRLGDPRIMGPALLASYLTGRISNLPDVSAASARVAGATLGAVVLCEGLKLAVGRVRPFAAPGDPDQFHPFDWNDSSFPSGHTTFAFAAASAIDAETQARWVPWVVYPAAAAVGWARVEQDEHWLSDVAAGAALGYWTGRTIDRMERGRGLFDRAHFLFRGSRRSFRLGFQTKF